MSSIANTSEMRNALYAAADECYGALSKLKVQLNCILSKTNQSGTFVGIYGPLMDMVLEKVTQSAIEVNHLLNTCENEASKQSIFDLEPPSNTDESIIDDDVDMESESGSSVSDASSYEEKEPNRKNQSYSFDATKDNGPTEVSHRTIARTRKRYNIEKCERDEPVLKRAHCIQIYPTAD